MAPKGPLTSNEPVGVGPMGLGFLGLKNPGKVKQREEEIPVLPKFPVKPQAGQEDSRSLA